MGEKKILITAIVSGFIFIVFVISVVTSGMIALQCGWHQTYKCFFIPFLSFILIIISMVSLSLIWIFRNNALSLIFGIFLLAILVLFFLFFIPEDFFKIKDTPFICELSSNPFSNSLGESDFFAIECMTKYALQYHDFSYCDKLKWNDHLKIYRFSCYSKIANSPEDANFCEKIDKGHAGYQECYFNIANSTNDPRWCEYILQSEYYSGNYNLSKSRIKEMVLKCTDATKN